MTRPARRLRPAAPLLRSLAALLAPLALSPPPALSAPGAQAQKIFRCTVDGRTVFQQSACAGPPPAAAVAASAAAAEALARDAQACLEHLKPLLRDPASARWKDPQRGGDVLRLSVLAGDARGTLRQRPAACTFAGGAVDSQATREQLKRLGWLQPAAEGAGGDDAAARRQRRAREENIEAPAS